MALFGTAVAAAHASGYRINTTPSVPVGLWRMTPHAAVTRGMVALWCPPDRPAFRLARARGFIPEGRCAGGYTPLLKPVAAVGGDTVTVTPTGIRVNGVALPNSAPLARDGAGRALPRLAAGRYGVPEGEVWLVSSYNPHSFDARYFGPVAASHIEGVVRPVYTRGGAE